MARSLVLVLIDENGNDISYVYDTSLEEVEQLDPHNSRSDRRRVLNAPQNYTFTDVSYIGEFYRYEAGDEFNPKDSFSLSAFPIYSTPYSGPWYQYLRDGSNVWDGEIRVVYKIKRSIKKTIRANVEILPVDIKDSGAAWAVNKEIEFIEGGYPTNTFNLKAYPTITINSISYGLTHWILPDNRVKPATYTASDGLRHLSYTVYYDNYPLGDTTLTFTAIYRPLTGKILLNKEGTEIVTYNGCIVLDL